MLLLPHLLCSVIPSFIFLEISVQNKFVVVKYATNNNEPNEISWCPKNGLQHHRIHVFSHRFNKKTKQTKETKFTFHCSNWNMNHGIFAQPKSSRSQRFWVSMPIQNVIEIHSVNIYSGIGKFIAFRIPMNIDDIEISSNCIKPAHVRCSCVTRKCLWLPNKLSICLWKHNVFKNKIEWNLIAHVLFQFEFRKESHKKHCSWIYAAIISIKFYSK